jgi:hypothetical protein
MSILCQNISADKDPQSQIDPATAVHTQECQSLISAEVTTCKATIRLFLNDEIELSTTTQAVAENNALSTIIHAAGERPDSAVDKSQPELILLGCMFAVAPGAFDCHRESFLEIDSKPFLPKS